MKDEIVTRRARLKVSKEEDGKDGRCVPVRTKGQLTPSCL